MRIPRAAARGDANLPALHDCSLMVTGRTLLVCCQSPARTQSHVIRQLVEQLLPTIKLCLENTSAASLTWLSSCGSSVHAAHLVGLQPICKVLHLLLVLEKLICQHTELGDSLLLPDIWLQHAIVQHLLVALQQPACKNLQMLMAQQCIPIRAGSSKAPGSA